MAEAAAAVPSGDELSSKFKTRFLAICEDDWLFTNRWFYFRDDLQRHIVQNDTQVLVRSDRFFERFKEFAVLKCLKVSRLTLSQLRLFEQGGLLHLEIGVLLADQGQSEAAANEPVKLIKLQRLKIDKFDDNWPGSLTLDAKELNALNLGKNFLPIRKG